MEWLANLSIKWVLVAIGVLMVALTAARLAPAAPRERSSEGAADWFIENIQVVLSVVVVVFLIIRPFLFQAFYIPSDSMVPTLLGPQQSAASPLKNQTQGDRLLVNKLIYRVSDPQRFDIAVFKAPLAANSEEREFIKRVVALPGETIEVVPSRLMIDGRAAFKVSRDASTAAVSPADTAKPQINPEHNVATLKVGYQDEFLKVIARPDPQIRFDGTRVEVDGEVELTDEEGVIEVKEGLTAFGGDPDVDGTVYVVNGEPRLAVVRGVKLEYDAGHVLIDGERLKEPYLAEPPDYSMTARKLASNEYFMLGDNRNNSNDSHVWGPLTRDRIIGRAEILFWPIPRFHIFQWWLVTVLVGLFAGYHVVYRVLGGK